MATMTPSVFYIKQSDTLPIITATLIDQFGTVANLTGATVYFRMTNTFFGNVINRTATVVSAVNGQVSYSWQSGDTNNTGVFNVQWFVVYGSGAQESYPQGFYSTVQIDPSLNSGFSQIQPSPPVFNTIWNSTSAPTSAQGNNGDFWINTATQYFYGPKANGTWPAGTLINPAGAPLNSFGAPTGNVNMGGYSFNNLAYINASPTSSSRVPLTGNIPSGSTADIIDLQINGATFWKVTSAGVLTGTGLSAATAAVAPSGLSTTALSVTGPTGTSVDVADFMIGSTVVWKITSYGSLTGFRPHVISPTASGDVPLTANTPAGSTVDVADFQQNGVTVASVNSSGNVAILNNKQLDLTNANASPFVGAASVSFAPVIWGASGTNPAIGNGTLTGSYIKYGRLIFINITLISGTTTTYGTGTWQFTLPFSPANSARIAAGTVIGATSTGSLYAGTVLLNNVSSVATTLYPPTTAGAANFAGSQSTPFSWAASTANQQLVMQFMYETTT
jgi:hypothetical protein